MPYFSITMKMPPGNAIQEISGPTAALRLVFVWCSFILWLTFMLIERELLRNAATPLWLSASCACNCNHIILKLLTINCCVLILHIVPGTFCNCTKTLLNYKSNPCVLYEHKTCFAIISNGIEREARATHQFEANLLNYLLTHGAVDKGKGRNEKSCTICL